MFNKLETLTLRNPACSSILLPVEGQNSCKCSMSKIGDFIPSILADSDLRLCTTIAKAPPDFRSSQAFRAVSSGSDRCSIVWKQVTSENESFGNLSGWKT